MKIPNNAYFNNIYIKNDAEFLGFPILPIAKILLRGPNSGFEGFGPQDWDLGLETGKWASRLRYGPGGEGGGRRRRRRRRKFPCVKA